MNASETWITEAILVEIANGLSTANRSGAISFIKSCYRTQNIKVVGIDSALLNKGLELYQARSDKRWGLTDCLSFVVMSENNIQNAATADIHFVQAGYTALMLV